MYILGREVLSLGRTDGEAARAPRGRYTLRLADFPDALTCSVLVCPSSSSVYPVPEGGDSGWVAVPPGAEAEAGAGVAVARCIAVVDRVPGFMLTKQTETETEPSGEEPAERADTTPLDTAVLVFPPSASAAAVTALVTGAGTMSCPAGRCALSRPSFPSPQTRH